MCGIAGHVTFTGYRPNRIGVEQAIDKLYYRGPDEAGVSEYKNACFGHRRLRIIDLARGKQPWHSSDNRYCLIFNGEIYNYIELRKRLVKLGWSFISNCDTEVLLAMFIHYGPDCLEFLNGMFAFAVWDEQKKTAFIARDRLGKKPLYYTVDEKCLTFASELPALLPLVNQYPDINLSAVHDFFAYQFIPGETTIYKNVYKLLPGHHLTFSDEGPKINCYWTPPHPENGLINEAKASEHLADLVDDSVRLRMHSDVPVGLFLSGGLDSSIILDSMSRLGTTINTFTVGFGEKTFDERNTARIVAKRYQTQHYESLLDIEPENLILNCINKIGEPFADPSALPTLLLCRQTSKHVTVALTGDGADEIFGGYQRYRALGLLPFYQRIPTSIRQYIFEPLIEFLPDTTAYYGASTIKKLKLFLNMTRRLYEAPHDLLPQAFTLNERLRLLDPELIDIRSADHISQFNLSGLDSLTQMMITDLMTYLSEDILYKTDRMSMAHSLEVRAPFLDYRVVEFASKLPSRLKLNHGRPKYILQRSFRHRLSEHTLGRRKHGFAVPIGKWLLDSLRPLFEGMVLDTKCPNYLNRNEILRIWKQHLNHKNDHGFKLWSILIFFIWHANYTAR